MKEKIKIDEKEVEEKIKNKGKRSRRKKRKREMTKTARSAAARETAGFLQYRFQALMSLFIGSIGPFLSLSPRR